MILCLWYGSNATLIQTRDVWIETEEKWALFGLWDRAIFFLWRKSCFSEWNIQSNTGILTIVMELFKTRTGRYHKRPWTASAVQI